MKDLTAILLCGGRGERLRPFTDALPKPLVPINGKPMLHHLIRFLYEGGVSKFVVCTGYKADAIEQYMRDNKQRDWEVALVNSGEEATMTDRVMDARKNIKGRVLVCYGDTLANVDLAALLNKHEEARAIATLSVYPMRSPYGVVDFNPDGKVTAFVEKPQLPYWINIGFLVLEPAALKLIKRGTDMVGFLDVLIATGKLAAYQHTGKHLTVNTEKDRVAAEEQMVEFFTLLDG